MQNRSGNTAGRYAMLEQFVADDMRYMFGNPGTVEEGFLDALGETEGLEYILTLQESVAAGMADGYARAMQKPALVQLHTGVGLGNAIGMLYQAMRGHSPLLVIASTAGLEHENMDAQMACDIVGMAKPVTKYATEVKHPEQVLRVLRRAYKIAATPPMGPVFVALPMDMIDAVSMEEVRKTEVPSTRVTPLDSDLEEAVQLLCEAKDPLILMGDGVSVSGAQKELVEVAEALGATVYGVNNSEVNMDATHPLYQGSTGHMFGRNSAEITKHADVILVCGTYIFPEVFPWRDGMFSEDVKIIHVDLNAYEIGKNFVADFSFVSDPKVVLSRLLRLIDGSQSTNQKNSAKCRLDESTEKKRKTLEIAITADETSSPDCLTMAHFAKELASQLDGEEPIIFDEALTSSPELNRYLPAKTPGRFFQTRGGSLGVGIPGAMGIKLARPDETVIGFTGDGGSMYTIQALWTAAHHRIGAKFVVCNNRSYKLLKYNILNYWETQDVVGTRYPVSFDLGNPDLEFHKIAESMGVEAIRVEKLEEVEGAVRAMLDSEGPFLIDLVLPKDVPGGIEEAHCVCGQ